MLATFDEFDFLAGMDLAAACQLIQSSLNRMGAIYLRPVFNEWAILSLAGKQGVLAYVGPRPDSFRQHFPEDVEPIRALMSGQSLVPGEFEFASEAEGTRYDASVKIGPSSYLLCNHTDRKMADIRRDPKWLNAQSVFFELCEKFRADPLDA